MDTNNDRKAYVEKSRVGSGKLKMVIGIVAVLADIVLAGLVYTRYEAGIPPAEPEPTSMNEQFITVTISGQNPLLPMESMPGDMRRATPADKAHSMRRPAES
jgi:hypothetical protein